MIFKKLFGSSKPKPSGPQHIQSSPAGPMERDASLAGYWTSEPVAIPLMGDVLLPVSYHDLLPGGVAALLPLYDAVLGHFLKLDVKTRDLATPHVFKQCRDTIDAADWEGRVALEAATRSRQLCGTMFDREVFLCRGECMIKTKICISALSAIVIGKKSMVCCWFIAKASN